MDAHPLHALAFGAGTYLLTRSAPAGVGVGLASLVYMMKFGHHLPFSSAPAAQDVPPAPEVPAVVIPSYIPRWRRGAVM